VLGIWREYAAKVEGRALPAGHYLPEEAPVHTAEAILEFLA
jgi:haloacetate dehalogenase